MSDLQPEDAEPESPTSRAARAGNQEISNRIAERYTKHVYEAEANRQWSYIQLADQDPIGPDQRDVANAIKMDLDAALKNAVGSGAATNKATDDPGWDKLFGHEQFKKRMQFLCGHAKTGHFIEQYGTQGQYDGEFLYGMRHGKGIHEFQGETYEGEWKWDHRHGWGSLALSDGSHIKGEWANGKPHGFTSMIDKRGTVVYEGEFKNGKRDGLGRQLFESGDMYNGGWKDGRLHDRGVYYFTNGDKLYGMWNQGLYDGIGVFHYADGSISRRVYKDGILKSVQDYEQSSQRFGKTLTREGMQRHTCDPMFPKEVFLLNSV